MNWTKESFLVSTDKTKLQIDRIHHFLSKEAYWSLNIPRTTIEKAIQNSLCIGLYKTSKEATAQIGFARVVTDSATFAWVCDVYVEPDYRGKKLAEWMMECLKSHPSLQNLRRICLTTKDAHHLYEKSGFELTKTPDFWMEIKKSNAYQNC